jgi:hypothetical protein
MENNKGITINFAEKYAHLICKDIPPLQLKSYPYRIQLPKEYRKTFIHTEEGFAYKFCMSEEEQKEVRNARKKTLQNSVNK